MPVIGIHDVTYILLGPSGVYCFVVVLLRLLGLQLWLGVLLLGFRLNIGMTVVGFLLGLFEMFVVGFGLQFDIFAPMKHIRIHIFTILALINRHLLLSGFLLRVVAQPTILQMLVGVLPLLPLPHIMISIYRQFPPLLLVLVFLVLAHIQRLIVLSGQFLLGSEFVPDCLVDPGSAASPLDVGGVQTPHIGFVMGNGVLEGVFFRTGENAVVLDL